MKLTIPPTILFQVGNQVHFHPSKAGVFLAAVITVNPDTLSVETTDNGFPVKIKNWKKAISAKMISINPN